MARRRPTMRIPGKVKPGDAPPECRGCPLYGWTVKVPGSGPNQTEFAIVGEGPGAQERLRGLPFIGPSGELLWKHAFRESVRKENVYVTNVEKCFIPPDRKEALVGAAVSVCKTRLFEELKARGVKYVLALGNEALSAMCGIRGVTKYHGRVLPSHGGEFKVVPAIHPAALLRMGERAATPLFMGFQRSLAVWANHCIQKGERPIFKDYRVIRDTTVATEFLKTLYNEPAIVIDLETSGFHLDDDYILCIGFSRGADDATVITDDACNADEFVDEFRMLARLYEGLWVAHNLIFEKVRMAWTYQVRLRGGFDTMLAHYAFDENRGGHDLKSLAMKLFGAPNWEGDIKKYLKKPATDSYALLPEAVLYEYNAQDIIYTWMLYELFVNMFAMSKHASEKRVFDTLLMPGSELSTDMQLNGLHVDDEQRVRMYGVCARLEANATSKLRRLSGNPKLNPRSTQQNARVLYDQWGAPTWSHSATGGVQGTHGGMKTPERTTSKAQLARLVRHPELPRVVEFAETLLKYRGAKHLRSNYLDHFIPNLDGRIHPNFAMHRTVTGRLASADPNVMNMSHENGIRGVFTAEPGCVLICADYKQMELRVAALESGDKNFQEIFIKGLDIHDTVAKWFYSDNYTTMQRLIAKSFVFGFLYGRGWESISIAFGISREEALQKMQLLRNIMSGFFAWGEKQFRLAQSRGYVISRLGRKRRFPLITNRNAHEVRRYVMNAPIQSAASDILLLAMMDINEWIGDYDGKILMPLHDSGNYEVPEEVRDEVALKITQSMMAAPIKVYGDDSIPFGVDIEFGSSLDESTLHTIDVDKAELERAGVLG